jgi:hypothetical protein
LLLFKLFIWTMKILMYQDKNKTKYPAKFYKKFMQQKRLVLFD